MSIKSFIQILIIILILSIIGGVYFKYFDSKKNIIEEISLTEMENKDQLKNLEIKISELELKNKELSNKIENKKNNKIKLSQRSEKNSQKSEENKVEKKKDKKINEKKNNLKNKEIDDNENIIKNLVKDVEYTSIDQRGNKFYLLANSGKSNSQNNDILDLKNVRGKITSDKRDTIYIVSDFAQYNSVNLNSKFYQNVIINYQDKEITCINFDINMETNKAIAYNDVLIIDPKSEMKAGIVEFDLKTKDININPDRINKEIEVITN